MNESITFERGALVRRAGPVVEALTPTPLIAAGLAGRCEPAFLASIWASLQLVDALVLDRAVRIRTLH